MIFSWHKNCDSFISCCTSSSRSEESASKSMWRMTVKSLRGLYWAMRMEATPENPTPRGGREVGGWGGGGRERREIGWRLYYDTIIRKKFAGGGEKKERFGYGGGGGLTIIAIEYWNLRGGTKCFRGANVPPKNNNNNKPWNGISLYLRVPV